MVGSLTTSRGYLHDRGAASFGVPHVSPLLDDLALANWVRWTSTELSVAVLHGPVEPALLWSDPARTVGGRGADGPAWLGLHAWWKRTGRGGSEPGRAGAGPVGRDGGGPSAGLGPAADALGVCGGLQWLQRLRVLAAA